MNLYELSTTTNSLRKQVGAVPVNVVTRRIVRYIHNLSGVKRDARSIVSVSQTVTYGLKNARLIKMPVVMTANRRLLYHDRLTVGGFERETKPHMRWSSDVGHEVATTMFGELWHERESRPTLASPAGERSEAGRLVGSGDDAWGRALVCPALVFIPCHIEPDVRFSLTRSGAHRQPSSCGIQGLTTHIPVW